ncbi:MULTISPECIES: glutamate--tRNA ligase family protein [unclassified Anaerobiospirillum]|uniref:glutamate--tRNA ligase family protein n=1 Tax=unclassified Anaerobiospirillum TaxID=2647410 RepID=UPI001FF429A1|nr:MULTISPECIES: glutamate--tRNA ligase family protein [unclassified Anaerobiospirillum]MCK0535011.1 glutamate--tRNA ligase family protein [Anaerobiospirillum sp. NML120511]MCK0540233.1 glutamate--tRNA ligase family protein [Anaerobiospirillum sp. NML02-A-032]
MTYCGRFAPSPSGRLHQGSLVAGYAALLRCLNHQGRFIVRIEDLDFPRCPPANTPVILTELALLGIKSPLSPVIQSCQLEDYHEVMNVLTDNGTAYFCECTRALMKQRPCPCHEQQVQEKLRTADADHLAIRIELKECLKHYPSFKDNNLGMVSQCDLGHELASSLVLRRADGIIAYNLAVVVDDHNEGISEVVRGADMLDATFLQLCLYDIMGWTAPEFFHVPLITDPQGNKLSKQNKAPAVLSTMAPHQAFIHTCRLLGQQCDENCMNMAKYLDETFIRAGLITLEIISRAAAAANAAAAASAASAEAARCSDQGHSRSRHARNAAATDLSCQPGSTRHTALTSTVLGLGLLLTPQLSPARGFGHGQSHGQAPATSAAPTTSDARATAACHGQRAVPGLDYGNDKGEVLTEFMLPDSGIDISMLVHALCDGGADGAGMAAVAEVAREYAHGMDDLIFHMACAFNVAAMPHSAIVI